MKFKVILTPSAKVDLREARAWYARINHDLGKQFTAEARLKQLGIAANPFAFSAINSRLWSCFLEVFPYSYHFHVADSSIVIIVGLYHHSRNPTIWRDAESE